MVDPTTFVVPPEGKLPGITYGQTWELRHKDKRRKASSRVQVVGFISDIVEDASGRRPGPVTAVILAYWRPDKERKRSEARRQISPAGLRKRYRMVAYQESLR